MTIEIVVDELVVRGLSPVEARAAAAAFEAQLTALAATPAAIATRSESVRLLPAVEAGTPAGVGEAAAGAVWRELSG
jgi:hypothetical protein